MKKTLSIVLALAFVIALLGGCGNSNTTTGEKTTAEKSTQAATTQAQPKKDVTLKLINTKIDSKDFFTQLLADFTAESGIKVEYDVLAGDQYSKVLPTRVASGDMPDVIQVFPGATETGVERFAKNGDIMDITNEPFVKNMIDSAISQLTIDGKQYCIATSQNVLAVEYNKKLFAQAGIGRIPTDIKEFYDVCEKLKAAKITPMAIMGKQGLYFEGLEIIPSIVIAKDPDFMKKAKSGDPSATFTNDLWKKAYTLMEDMSKKGFFEDKPFSIDYNGAMDMFTQGKAAMIANGNWAFSDMKKKGGDSFEFGAFFFPSNDPGEELYTVGSISEMYSIANSTKNPVEAKALLQYFNDKAAKLLTEYNGLPVTKGVTMENVEPATTELLPVLEKNKSYDFISSYWPAGMNDVFSKGQQELLAGNSTIDKILNDLNDYYVKNKDK